LLAGSLYFATRVQDGECYNYKQLQSSQLQLQLQKYQLQVQLQLLSNQTYKNIISVRYCTPALVFIV